MKILIFIFMALVASVVQSQTLSPAGYLNKMSMALRGMSPSPSEYSELASAVQSGQGEAFLKNKKTAYISSSLYVEKMRFRLEDLFRLMPDSASPSIGESRYPGDFNSFRQSNTTDDLFIRMISENGSWDRLLTDKTYYTFSLPSSFNVDNEADFYSAIDPKLSKVITPQESIEPTQFSKHKLEFSPDDLRLAGVITSPRFFARYGTTGVNKNRRRAAAIFRTFLCDSMSAAVPDPGQNMKQIYDLQFPADTQAVNTASMSAQDVVAASKLKDSIHGTQKDCMSCHYKLDPMGQTLRGSQFIPSGAPWAGRLTYKTAKGTLTDVAVAGIGELGQAITKQPEYLSCQVGYFWNWFIGRDVVLTEKIRSELVSKFEEVGRQPNDFVSYLVERPEFKIRVAVDPVLANSRKVHDLLERCQSCHQGKTDDVTGDALIDLTAWPLGKNSSNHDPAFWLSQISAKVGLADGGKTRKMPPESAHWSLSRQDLLSIQQWIENGAPDESGKKQVVK